MFPIAHAWLLEQVTPSPSAASYLGCVWPDMLFGSQLTHTQSHREGLRLVAMVEALPASEAREEARDFVWGALSHCSEPHGFDWYSDEQWDGLPPEQRGYAFQHGRALASAAAQACGVEEAAGWWKAHNLVEMAFERSLYTAAPALGERLVSACADTALHQRIAGLLASAFELDAEALAVPMRRFASVVQLRPDSLEALATVYAVQVRLKHPGAEPDEGALAQLIGEAEHLIAADREAYLARCVQQVGAMLRATLPLPPLAG